MKLLLKVLAIYAAIYWVGGNIGQVVRVAIDRPDVTMSDGRVILDEVLAFGEFDHGFLTVVSYDPDFLGGEFVCSSTPLIIFGHSWVGAFTDKTGNIYKAKIGNVRYEGVEALKSHPETLAKIEKTLAIGRAAYVRAKAKYERAK